YWAGFMQGEMWKYINPDGTLAYSFNQTVDNLRPFYMARAFGGFLFICVAMIMAYNLFKTARQGKFLADESAQATALVNSKVGHVGEHWHSWIERRPVKFLVLAVIAILIGGIVELIPTFMVNSNITKIESVEPYTPLELEGRDIYIREGCYNC